MWSIAVPIALGELLVGMMCAGPRSVASLSKLVINNTKTAESALLVTLFRQGRGFASTFW